jgi:hypothetical protein
MPEKFQEDPSVAAITDRRISDPNDKKMSVRSTY